MGTFLQVFGWIAILAGLAWLVVWLVHNGHIHRWATQLSGKLPEGEVKRAASVLAAQTLPEEELHPARPAVRAAQKAADLEPEKAAAETDLPIQTRLENLTVGNTIQLTATSGKTINEEVVAVITHHEMLQNEGGWHQTGDTFKLCQLRAGEWMWIRQANFALFERSLQITDVVMDGFKRNAQEYGKQQAAYEKGDRNEPPDVKLTIEEHELSITDIGKSELKIKGLTNAKDGEARFMIAEDSEGRMLWVEDRKIGADVVMFGHRLELSDIQDIQ